MAKSAFVSITCHYRSTDLKMSKHTSGCSNLSKATLLALLERIARAIQFKIVRNDYWAGYIGGGMLENTLTTL